MAKCKNCKNCAYLKDEYGDGYLWCFELEEDCSEDRIVIPCHAYEPKTNADRIRSMTDEQLAHYLEGFSYGGMKVDANKILRWLKSEVGCE